MEEGESVETLWQLIEEVHRRMNESPNFKEMFARQEMELEYCITDLDLVFTIHIDHGCVVALRSEAAEPAMRMELSSAYLHKLFTGKLIVPVEMLKRRIKVTMHNQKKAMGAAPLASLTSQYYGQVYGEFKAAGRWVPDAARA